MTSCYICGGEKFIRRPGKVRDNASLEVMECTDCGLVFLSAFSHIKEGFYENSGMHDGTIDITNWIRETSCDDERRFNYLRRELENRSVLDLLKAKEAAKQADGLEPENALKMYFQTNALNVYSKIDDIADKYDLITLFHVLEHLPDPRSMLVRVSELLERNGQIIVEVPNAKDALLTLYNCEPFTNFTYWSCHLFLFTKETLIRLGEQAGLKIDYVEQVQRYPISNHLYWLSKGKPGGHFEWNFIDSTELNAAYEKQLSNIGVCDTIIAGFSKYD